MRVLHCFFLISILLACKQAEDFTSVIQQESIVENTADSTIAYNFDIPDTLFILEADLDEISGLEYNSINNQLISHNDEQGYVFELDIESGKILNKTKFGSKGDYEGVAKVGDRIYITKHTGTVLEYDPSTKITKDHKTPLSSRNDVEGLCLDKRNNQLLMACKGQSLPKKKLKNEKCIYAFDLTTHTLNEQPVLTIKREDLKEWVESNYKQDSKKDLNKKIKRIEDFSPSGLSFNNDQGALYIISAKGSTLLIYDQELKLSSLHFLNSKTIPQPEGICFDNDNNLYISTEGQGFHGKIFKFKYNG